MKKSSDAGNYHNVRCSINNPQHVYVHKVLCDLNLDIFKSRNQFIIDAIEYYSKALNQEDLTNTAAMEYIQKEKLTKETDLDKLKREVVNEVMGVVQREVIAILAQAVAMRSEMVRVEQPSSDHKTDATDKETINPIVADMASLWGEDEETEE